MKQRVRFAAAASGAAALAYIVYHEIRHLATRRRKLEALGRVGVRFQAASLDRMVRCDPKRLRRMLRALLLMKFSFCPPIQRHRHTGTYYMYLLESTLVLV